jgi:hypothetical protein
MVRDYKFHGRKPYQNTKRDTAGRPVEGNDRGALEGVRGVTAVPETGLADQLFIPRFVPISNSGSTFQTNGANAVLCMDASSRHFRRAGGYGRKCKRHS